jgi:hypothetical protein
MSEEIASWVALAVGNATAAASTAEELAPPPPDQP